MTARCNSPAGGQRGTERQPALLVPEAPSAYERRETLSAGSAIGRDREPGLAPGLLGGSDQYLAGLGRRGPDQRPGVGRLLWHTIRTRERRPGRTGRLIRFVTFRKRV